MILEIRSSKGDPFRCVGLDLACPPRLLCGAFNLLERRVDLETLLGVWSLT